jgi:TDG/mug DNA glycosylase family protein
VACRPHRPTRAEQEAAAGLTIPDVVAPGLRVLFSGINPGLYSAATGHHFARPGNRFWPALYGSGFTSRLLSPFEQDLLLDVGLGITMTAYRTAFGQPRAVVGRQDTTIGDTPVWVLPNPSGLNAHRTPPMLAADFRELREAVDGGRGLGCCPGL